MDQRLKRGKIPTADIRMIHQFEELWLNEKQIRNALFLDCGERACGIVAGPQHNGSATQQRDVDEYLRQIGEWASHQLAAIWRTRNMNLFRVDGETTTASLW